MKIRDEILERINSVRERIAQAIHDSDWSTVGWNVALVLAVVMVAVALAVGTLALVGKSWAPCWARCSPSRWCCSSWGCLINTTWKIRTRPARRNVTLIPWSGGLNKYMGMSGIPCTTLFKPWRAGYASSLSPTPPGILKCRTGFSVKANTWFFNFLCNSWGLWRSPGLSRN